LDVCEFADLVKYRLVFLSLKSDTARRIGNPNHTTKAGTTSNSHSHPDGLLKTIKHMEIQNTPGIRRPSTAKTHCDRRMRIKE
jgi:hypothetical protein